MCEGLCCMYSSRVRMIGDMDGWILYCGKYLNTCVLFGWIETQSLGMVSHDSCVPVHRVID